MARNTSGPVQQYGGTTAQHGNYVGAPREITVDITKNTAVVHDGKTISGFPLAREDRQILAGDSIIKVEGPGDLSGDTTIKLDPDKVAEWNLKEATYVDTIPTDETQFEEFISGLDEGAIVVETSGSGSANVAGLTPEEAAHAAMPSSKFIALDFSVSSAEFIAPADGFIHIAGTATAVGGYVAITDVTTGLSVHHEKAVLSGVGGFLPVAKGDTFGAYWNNVTINKYRFIYCNGSAPE